MPRLLALTLLCIIALGPVHGLTAATINKKDQRLLDNLGEALPARAEGEGQYGRLIIRGATLIDGTGAPPRGPVDVVVEGDRIAGIHAVGFPGLPIKADRRPAAGDREIDAHGKYLLPGFVDSHAHIHNAEKGQKAPPEYIFKLWLGHGVTTVRELYDGKGEDRTLALKQLSANNAITAPRIVVYPYFGQYQGRPISTPAQARARVKELKKKGADGIKFFGARENILAAALAEAEQLELPTTMHHAQLDVAHANVLDTSAQGLDCMEHWYGLPEALFGDRIIQDYPSDYLYSNEQDRFAEAGRLWAQASEPGSELWNAVMDTLLERDFCISPTFTIYAASRDLMRAYTAEWHRQYTLPDLWNFYRASRERHGAYFFNWTTANEVDWRNNYQRWMQFVNEYKNRGGKVVVGSDTGYIYSLYGFGYIQELEMLQEAGFHPLEVIRAATRIGAQVLGREDDIGTVHIGKKADLIIVDENPLHNLKSLYGTGVPKLNSQSNRVERVGGVRWTIKDGIVYDAAALREDVRDMVSQAKQTAGMDANAILEIESP